MKNVYNSIISKVAFIVLVFVFSSQLGYSQLTRIRGKVIDTDTKEPLSFVTLAFKGTTIGTITDTKGEFFLETRSATDALTVSYVGYDTKIIPIKKGQYQELNIELKSTSLSLEGVTIVPGENPAHPILRKIIKNKKHNNPDRLNAYSYESYNKIEVDLNNVDDNMKKKKIFKQFQFVFNYVDTNAITGKTFLPIFITEAISDYHFQRSPKVEKEVIKASKISGVNNESVAQFTGKIYQRINLYDNFINVFDQGLISPISDVGLFYYKYYLIDSAFLDHKWCYQISFKPKRRMEPTFTGDFWVNDSTWAIVKAQVRLAEYVNLNFVNDLVASAEYQKINDTTWFPKQLSLFVDFNLTDKTTGFFGRKTTSFSNVKLNEPVLDTIQSLQNNVTVQEGAMQQNDDYWKKSRPFELTKKEAGIYQMVDSVKHVPMYKTFFDIVNMIVNYYYVTGYIEIGPYYKTYSFNEVEGNRFRISGRTSNKFSKRVMFSTFAAYGDKDNRFKYGLGALYIIKKKPRQVVDLEYKSDIEQLGQSQYALTEDNLMTSILRRNPNYKLTLVDELSGYYQREWFNGFSNKLSFSYRSIYPSDSIRFDKIDGGTVHAITTASLTLNTRWLKDEKFVAGEFERVSLGSNYPEINFDVTGALKGVFGSQYTYAKLHFSYYHKFNINPFGYTRLILDAGKIFGKVPYPLLQLHEGNETYAFDRYAFNMMNYYEFASDQYASVTAEHHFQGFFLNHIPLMRRLKWREVVTGKYLVGSISDMNYNKPLNFPTGLGAVSKPYAEVGVGIENIFKVIRIDAMWRLTHLDNPNIEKFGIRAGLQIIF